MHTDQHTIMAAVNSNNIETVQQFLPQAGITWNADDVFAFACQKGRIDIIKLLLGVSDPNADHGKALQHAVGGRHYDVVKLILPHCDATLLRSEALQLSVIGGEKEIFELLHPYSDCDVALMEVNASIQLLCIDNEKCLQLRDRLTEIVQSQQQKQCLMDHLDEGALHERISRKL